MWTDCPPSRRCLAGLVALALALSGQSLAIDRSQHGQYASCREGNCDNGRGTIVRVDRQKAYTGQWSNGRFVEGMYEVQYAGSARTFPMRMGADGIPLEGTRAFPDGTEKYPVYTGTFGPPPDTFVTEGNPLLAIFRKPDSVLKNGRYIDTARGYVYEGEFYYIPVAEKLKGTQFGEVTLASGVYVMLGSRIDETLDEVETGVFASDGTVGPDVPFYLTPASASYMAQLQEALAATHAGIQADKAASARASREAWGTFLGVMSGVAVVVLAKKAASSDNSASVTALKSALEGREDPAVVARRIQEAQGPQAAVPARSSNIMTTAVYKRLREDAASSSTAAAVPAASIATVAQASAQRASAAPAVQAAPAAPAKGRRKIGGTMYISAYAVVKHSKTGTVDFFVEMPLSPVQWSYELANVTEAEAAKIKAPPYPIPDNLHKQVNQDFREYLKEKYPQCGETPSGERGCYAISTNVIYGSTLAEAQQRYNQTVGTNARKRVLDTGFAMPTTASYSE